MRLVIVPVHQRPVSFDIECHDLTEVLVAKFIPNSINLELKNSMKFPFFLLIVISNPDSGSITSVTPFQTEAERMSAKRVIEDIKTETRPSLNVFEAKRVVLCEQVTGKERQVR